MTLVPSFSPADGRKVRTAAELAPELDGLTSQAALSHLVTDVFAGRIALVSSFGAESAVLLHMVASIDPSTPVLFLDTGKHFAETLTYRDQLVAELGLTDVRSIEPDPADLARHDADGRLSSRDHGLCCHLRKVLPLERALAGFEAWITGRKSFQAETRQGLGRVEQDGARIKVNPLAHWSSRDVAAYIDQHRLPLHPLLGKGYRSIGCAPCTTPVAAHEDARAGRWRGTGKVECGIHFVGGKMLRGLPTERVEMAGA